MGLVLHDQDLRCFIHRLEREACAEAAIPQDIARRAARSAIRALADEPDTPLLRRRAQAYFDAVVRRGLVRGPRASCARARVVLATVEAEMRAAGYDERGVWEEITRGWSDKIPPSVLEEYRQRLCA